MRKYDFTGETLEWYGRTLKRIRALKDFGDVEKGDIGGWIEKEENLSHIGDCWVYDSAKVYDSAEVYGSAKVYGSAEVSCLAEVYGSAKVYGSAEVTTTRDYITINPIGSRNDVTTAFRTDNGVRIECGCFYGSIAEFEKQVKETHGDSQYAKEYLAFVELLKIRFGEE